MCLTAINFELREDNINIPNPQGNTTHFKNRDGVPQKEREREREREGGERERERERERCTERE